MGGLPRANLRVFIGGGIHEGAGSRRLVDVRPRPTAPVSALIGPRCAQARTAYSNAWVYLHPEGSEHAARATDPGRELPGPRDGHDRFPRTGRGGRPLEVGLRRGRHHAEARRAKPVYIAGFGQNRKATESTIRSWPAPSSWTTASRRSPSSRVDLVGLFHRNVGRTVRKQLPGFAYVLVSSTHNHEGPDTLGLWGPTPFTSGVDPDYLKLVEDRIVEAVKEADEAASRSTARIGTAPAPELLHDGREPLRQARRAGGAAVPRRRRRTAGRHRRAVELPSRDARQQEHRAQRRLRRLHGRSTCRRSTAARSST